MKFSIQTHNILDYVSATTLVFSPYIFQFESIEPARSVFIFSGLGLALYSGLTRYRYSLLKLIPLGTHMLLDVLSGLVLMAAPWVFNYQNDLTNAQMALHFVLGLGVWGLVAFTEPVEPRKSNPGIARNSDFPIRNVS